MTEKHYSDDWAKDKSRDLVRTTIDDTLMTFRKPKQMKVLCFPGIDALEILQVYDQLGIPRKNITGIERYKDVADAIRAKNLGINVVNDTLENYVAKQSQFDLDVISLDYTQPISNEEIDTVTEMVKKQKRNNFVLHVANSIRRDAQSDDLYRGGLFGIDVSLHKQSIEENSAAVKDSLAAIDGFNTKRNENESSSIEKSRAFSKLILSTCSGYGYIGAGERFSEQMDKIINFLSGPYKSEIMDQMKEVAKKVGLEFIPSEKGPMSSIKNKQFVEAYSVVTIKELLEQRTKNTLQKIDGLNSELCNAMMHHTKDEGFYRSVLERYYSYISESGCPMVGDILFLQKPIYMLNHASNLMNLIGFPRDFAIKDQAEFSREYVGYVKSALEFYYKIKKFNGQIDPLERSFLGNASKPVLSKKRFLEELDAGHDVNYVKEKYRGWKNKPLTQWKAHYTMGTYSSAKMVDESDEDGDLEKITKEEAIGLLSSGIPPAEIAEAYPTSFKVSQLRGYKASISRGSYDSKENGSEVA